MLVSVLLHVHKNHQVPRDREPRTATSAFTQLLSFDNVRETSKIIFPIGIECSLIILTALYATQADYYKTELKSCVKVPMDVKQQ